MLSNFYKDLTNGLYFVSSKIRRYKAENIEETILVAGATKARKFHIDSGIRNETGWIAARRAVLLMTDQKMVCGDWEIKLVDIVEAKLIRLKSLFSKALVLKIKTKDDVHYQFGMQYDPAWEKQNALDLVIEEGKIKRSLFSI